MKYLALYRFIYRANFLCFSVANGNDSEQKDLTSRGILLNHVPMLDSICWPQSFTANRVESCENGNSPVFPVEFVLPVVGPINNWKFMVAQAKRKQLSSVWHRLGAAFRQLKQAPSTETIHHLPTEIICHLEFGWRKRNTRWVKLMDCFSKCQICTFRYLGNPSVMFSWNVRRHTFQWQYHNVCPYLQVLQWASSKWFKSTHP